MRNIKYVGLKPEEALLKIPERCSSRAIREKVEVYRNNVPTNFSCRLQKRLRLIVLRGRWLVPATLYGLIKGGLDSLVDFGASLAYISSKMWLTM